MSQTQVHHLNEANFSEFIANAEKPVVVDFWAPWCAPCRILGPVLEELADDMKDRITVAKVNVEENPSLAGQFAVSSIPSVKMFDKGSEVFSAIGAYPKEFWEQQINSRVG